MTDARNVYPRLCWGCLGVIEGADHDRALLNYGGWCLDCHMSQCGEMPGLRDALRGLTERMNDVSERDELLRETGNTRGEAMSENEQPAEGIPASGVTIRYTDAGGNTVDPPVNTMLTGFNYGAANPWGYNPTLGATAGAGAYMGNSWFAPQPGIGQAPVYAQAVPVLSDARVREMIREMLVSSEGREIVKAIVRETLEEDAREIATNPAFQAVYVPATGICWACGKPGKDDLRWCTRGGRSHLVHDSEECRRLASEKPETTEHRG